MSDIIIKVEELSKQYRLGQVGRRTLNHDVNRWWHTIRGKEDPYLKIGETNDRTIKSESDYVWALQNINFEVKQGEVLGIIGRNGAGKSTLLKILSKVTSPTKGKIKIKGRVASLLEVGTGFHPDLSGRDNIFLNGAILGMLKKEIRKKFDEIVDFAGVERYIDTPVKRYSSGMYVRLAFAVAAHLEPDILIVDEVLAVGDAEFQKKCLGKMKDVSEREGRTVLFVSHQMGSIAQLCNKALLLENGRIKAHGSINIVIDMYLENKNNNTGYKAGWLNKSMVIKEAFLQNDIGEKATGFTHLQSIKFIITVLVNERINNVQLRLLLKDRRGKAIFTSDFDCNNFSNTAKKEIIVTALIPANFLRPGEFVCTLALFVPHQFHVDLLEDILSFKVIDGGSKYAASEGLDYGYIFYDPEWKI